MIKRGFLLGISIVLMLAQPSGAVHAFSIENVSSVDTGGVVSGGKIRVTGSSSAAAEVRTIMRGSADGGASVSVTATTESDGRARTETQRFEFPSRASVRVLVAPDGENEENTAGPEAVATTESATIAAEEEGPLSFFVLTADRFFASLEGFISFFLFW